MIITLLGKGFKTDEDKRALYSFDEALSKKFKLKEKQNYTNMLPLLIDTFKDREILPIFTKEAKETQQVVLDDEFSNRYDELFKDECFIESTEDFASILRVLNGAISQNRPYIIDLTHSFRHLPILATISLIANHITDTSRVEHIFFAKEIVPFKEYQIIDLKEYLELANLSMMLSTFNQNYTVSSNMKFTNPLYQEIAKELTDFSNHFLSNSLKPLIEGELISDIIDNLEVLQKNKTVENFQYYIQEIIEHLEGIRQLKHENDYIKLYKLSKVMDNRGYQLNAITLLFEAVGVYCLDSLSELSLVGKRADEYKEYIQNERKPIHIYSVYTMVNQSRVIVKVRDGFKINDNRVFINSEEMKELIVEYLNGVKDLEKFKLFIESLEGLRNNLAHGNTSFSLKNVKSSYERSLEKFEKFIIKEKILDGAKTFKKKSSFERLNRKWQ